MYVWWTATLNLVEVTDMYNSEECMRGRLLYWTWSKSLICITEECVRGRLLYWTWSHCALTSLCSILHDNMVLQSTNEAMIVLHFGV